MNAPKLMLLLILAGLCGCVGTPKEGKSLKAEGRSLMALPVSPEPIPSVFEPATISTENARPDMASLLLAASAVLPQSPTQYLVWDGDGPFTVRTGPGRGNYTNSFTVTSNGVLYVPGLAYEVSNAGGSAPWPSNRVAELWLTGYGAGLSQATNIARLVRFTNTPPGNMQFWGIEDRTTGWE